MTFEKVMHIMSWTMGSVSLFELQTRYYSSFLGLFCFCSCFCFFRFCRIIFIIIKYHDYYVTDVFVYRAIQAPRCCILWLFLYTYLNSYLSIL